MEERKRRKMLFTTLDLKTKRTLEKLITELEEMDDKGLNVKKYVRALLELTKNYDDEQLLEVLALNLDGSLGKEAAQKFEELKEALVDLQRTGRYDVETYITSLLHQTGQLAYFYGVVANSEEEPFYHLYRRPCVHQLAYFNIGRGFPKELYDGHWCYILKDFGAKMLVVPCTSVKTEMEEIRDYEFDIQVSMQRFQFTSRMQLSDMRTLDVQRIDLRKSFMKVVTERDVIDQVVYQFIFGDEKKSYE